MDEIMSILIYLLFANYIVFIVVVVVTVLDYIDYMDESGSIKSFQLIKSKNQVLLYLIPYCFILDMLIRGIAVALKNLKEWYIGLN